MQGPTILYEAILANLRPYWFAQGPTSSQGALLAFARMYQLARGHTGWHEALLTGASPYRLAQAHTGLCQIVLHKNLQAGGRPYQQGLDSGLRQGSDCVG